MRRRKVLGALAGTGIAVVAGCSGDGDGDGDQAGASCSTPSTDDIQSLFPSDPDGFSGQYGTSEGLSGIGTDNYFVGRYEGPDDGTHDLLVAEYQSQTEAENNREAAVSEGEFPATGYVVLDQYVVVVDAQTREMARALLRESALDDGCASQLTFVSDSTTGTTEDDSTASETTEDDSTASGQATYTITLRQDGSVLDTTQHTGTVLSNTQTAIALDGEENQQHVDAITNTDSEGETYLTDDFADLSGWSGDTDNVEIDDSKVVSLTRSDKSSVIRRSYSPRSVAGEYTLQNVRNTARSYGVRMIVFDSNTMTGYAFAISKTSGQLKAEYVTEGFSDTANTNRERFVEFGGQDGEEHDYTIEIREEG